MAKSKQLVVMLENKPGSLAKLCTDLADGGINLLAISVPCSAEFGTALLIAEDHARAKGVLSASGLSVAEADVLTVELENRVGALAEVTKRLADENINVNYAYCSGSKTGKGTMGVFSVSDLGRAAQIFPD